MAYDPKSIIEAQYTALADERSAAYAALEAARVAEDEYTVMNAANRLIDADARRAALDNIAHRYVAGQAQQQQGSRWGLSKDEAAIAHGIASNDPNMTADQREQIYAQNRDRLRHMRATGAYRDDQGRSR